jgi:hypothetical protein
VGWIANSPRLLEVLVSSKREPCGSHGNWAGEGFSMRPIPLSACHTIRAQCRLFDLLSERIIKSAPGSALSIYAFFSFHLEKIVTELPLGPAFLSILNE